VTEGFCIYNHVYQVSNPGNIIWSFDKVFDQKFRL